MSAKHTPGPWALHDTDTPNHGLAVYGADGTRVGLLSTVRASGDACLIAAAPELLELLKAFPGASTSGEEYKALDAWLKRVNAAIERAEGRGS